MNRIVKVAILLVMLAIPACIILFLHSFGRNEYTLPVFYEKGLKMCETSSSPHIIPDFALISPISGTVTAKVLENKINVVTFFEPECTGDCSSIFDALANLQSDFASIDAVQILSISAGQLSEGTFQKFSRKYKSNPEKWLYLAQGPVHVTKLARCGFGLDDHEGQYPMDTVVLVDEERRIRGYYNITDTKEADRLVLEIRILLRSLET